MPFIPEYNICCQLLVALPYENAHEFTWKLLDFDYDEFLFLTGICARGPQGTQFLPKNFHKGFAAHTNYDADRNT